MWLAVIGLFSSEAFAASKTGGILHKILDFLHIKLSNEAHQWMHFMIRKSMHFVAYAILSALMFRAIRGQVTTVTWTWRWYAFAIVTCLLTSSADELNQLFTPGRGGSVKDVMLDMTGALFAQLVIYLATRQRWSASRVRQVA